MRVTRHILAKYEAIVDGIVVRDTSQHVHTERAELHIVYSKKSGERITQYIQHVSSDIACPQHCRVRVVPAVLREKESAWGNGAKIYD